MEKLIIAAIVLFLCLGANGQKDIITDVLRKNQVGKEFYFDSSTKEDELDGIYIRYLGIVKTNAGGKYKVLAWNRVWGPNKHTIGIVFIYGLKNEFVGKYHLGSGFDLPNKIENDSLIFSNKYKTNCDTNLVTKISFGKGLPKEFFLKCKGEYGDIYALSQKR